MKFQYIFSVFLVSLCFSKPSSAEINCQGFVRDTISSREDPASVIYGGSTLDYITQYWEMDGADTSYFCQKGGYCYPAARISNGIIHMFIELMNCEISSEQGLRDGREVLRYLTNSNSEAYLFFQDRTANRLIMRETPNEFDVLRGAFLSLSLIERQKLQNRLQNMGLYNGIIDGLFGRQTYQALLEVDSLMSDAGFGFGWRVDAQAAQGFLYQILSETWQNGAVVCDDCE